MPEPTIEEFEESGTYHRSYDLPGDSTSDEISEFIEENLEDSDDIYLIRYSWIDENGEEQWRSTYSHLLIDTEDWGEEFETEADDYGIGVVLGFQVVYMGKM